MDVTPWLLMLMVVGDDQRADLAKVAEAIRSDWFCSYCPLVAALATALEELQNCSRSCPCHSHSLESEADMCTYRRRRLHWQRSTGLEKPCAAKDLVAADLAVGNAMDVMRAVIDRCRELLMGDMGVLVVTVRDETMADLIRGLAFCFNSSSFILCHSNGCP